MKKLLIAYFSATGTTKAIVEAIAKGINEEEISVLDFTSLESRGEGDILIEDDTDVILGGPVYAGRIQAFAINQLKRIKGKGHAVCVAVFGNRAYDDALLEIYDAAKSNGFTVAGCGAFAAEHSFSHATGIGVAKGRPDEKDLAIAEQFGKAIAAKVDMGDVQSVVPSGNRPYKEGMSPTSHTPLTLTTCIKCGKCAAACPTNSIDEDFKCIIETCILCCACAKACPIDAKVITREGSIKFCEKLEASGRKEPVLFI